MGATLAPVRERGSGQGDGERESREERGGDLSNQ